MNKLIVLAFSLLSVVLAGCNGQGGEKVVAESADSASLRIAVLPTVHCLPFFVAEKCGMYENAGLDVSLNVFDAAMDADTAFANGVVNLLATDVAKFVHLRNSGEDVAAVINYDAPLYLLASKESGLESKDGLDEKVIAMTRNSWEDMAADKIVESVGLTTEDLNRPQINNLSLRANMLMQNQYEGAVLPEPWAAMCEAKGAVRLCATSDFGLKMGVLVVQDSLKDERTDDINKLFEVYDMAVDTLNSLLNSKRNVISYIPLAATADVPDSLLNIGEYSNAALLSDSVLSVTEKWVKEREWLKKR